MVVIITRYALFVMSQYDVILTSPIILDTLSLLVVQCVTALNVNYQRSKSGDQSKTQHSTLRQINAQLQKYQEQRACLSVMINPPEPPINDEARMMLILQTQAQVCGCINAHPGLPHQ